GRRLRRDPDRRRHRPLGRRRPRQHRGGLAPGRPLGRQPLDVLWLDALVVGDEPEAWSAAGFTVDGDEVAIGGVRIACTGDGAGADRWRLRADEPLPADVDGIATTTTDADPPAPGVHPNGVVSFDHVVLRSP